MTLTDEEKSIVPEMILNDLKYISVRSLYLDWFFPSAAEIATQLLNNAVKVYLKSAKRPEVIQTIVGWRGNETHNITRMIDYLNTEIKLGFELSKDKRDVLDNLYKLYKARYIETMDKGGCQTIMSDVHVIDETYAFFREKTKENLSEHAKGEMLIEKALSSGKDLVWGANKKSLASMLYKENQSFNP